MLKARHITVEIKEDSFVFKLLPKNTAQSVNDSDFHSVSIDYQRLFFEDISDPNSDENIFSSFIEINKAALKVVNTNLLFKPVVTIKNAPLLKKHLGIFYRRILFEVFLSAGAVNVFFI